MDFGRRLYVLQRVCVCACETNREEEICHAYTDGFYDSTCVRIRILK